MEGYQNLGHNKIQPMRSFKLAPGFRLQFFFVTHATCGIRSAIDVLRQEMQSVKML